MQIWLHRPKAICTSSAGKEAYQRKIHHAGGAIKSATLPASLARFDHWSADAAIANGAIQLGQNQVSAGARKHSVEATVTFGDPPQLTFAPAEVWAPLPTNASSSNLRSTDGPFFPCPDSVQSHSLRYGRDSHFVHRLGRAQLDPMGDSARRRSRAGARNRAWPPRCRDDRQTSPRPRQRGGVEGH